MDRGARFIHINVDPIIIGMLGPLERMAMRLMNKNMGAKVLLTHKLTFDEVMVVLENVDYRRVFLACVSRRILYIDSYERCDSLSKLTLKLDDMSVYNWAHQSVQHAGFGPVVTVNMINHSYTATDMNIFKAVLVPYLLYNKDFSIRNNYFWTLVHVLKPHQLYILPWLMDMNFVPSVKMSCLYIRNSDAATVKHNATYIYEQGYFSVAIWGSWIRKTLVEDIWDVDMAMFLMNLIGHVPEFICAYLDKPTALREKGKRALHIKLHYMCGCGDSWSSSPEYKRPRRRSRK